MHQRSYYYKIYKKTVCVQELRGRVVRAHLIIVVYSGGGHNAILG